MAKTKDDLLNQKAPFFKAHAGTKRFDQCFYLLTLHSDPLKEMSLSISSGGISRLKERRGFCCHRRREMSPLSLSARGGSVPPPALTAIINSRLHIA